MSIYPEINFQLDNLPSLPVPGPIELPNGERRWRRNQVACDTCHIRRVRCDLVFPSPCSRCLRKGIYCELTRKRQKRGRMARAKLANLNGACGVGAPPSRIQERQKDESCSPVSQPTVSPMGPTTPASVTQPWPPATDEIDALLALCMEDYRSVTDAPQLQAGLGLNITEEWLPATLLSKGFPELSAEDGRPLSTLPGIWNPVDISPHTPSQGHDPLIPSQPATNSLVPEHEPISRPSMKYPVLNTVIPFLETDLPPQLVCHLLELYFTRPFPNILRKSSFLADNFRVTSPALLTSMLWMAAIDYGTSLSISPSQKRNICQFLEDLTRRLLRSSDNVSPKNQEFSLVELHCSPTAVHRLMDHTVHLDHVITYIHIALIVSTEQNAASMGWYVKLCPSLLACFLILY